MKLTTLDMEIALSEYFNPRANLIVPNVHWGIFIHECDLLILTKAGYAYEVEIKVSKQDLIADKKKKHGHKDNRIKYLYFALPKSLEGEIEHVPEHAGIIIVERASYIKSTVLRNPVKQGGYKFTDKERYEIARLGALRIWTLKKKIQRMTKERDR